MLIALIDDVGVALNLKRARKKNRRGEIKKGLARLVECFLFSFFFFFFYLKLFIFLSKAVYFRLFWEFLRSLLLSKGP